MLEKASWIWNNQTEQVNTFADFLISFKAKKGNNYILYLSSCVNHMITLNGEYVPSSQREGYENEPEYQTLDITSSVKDGDNEIIITVYSQGIDSYIWRNRPAGLIFSLYENGVLIDASSEKTPSRPNKNFVHGQMEKISSMLGFTFKADLTATPLSFSSDNTVVVDKTKNLKARTIKDLTVMPNVASEISAQGVFFDKSNESVTLGTRAHNAFLSAKTPSELCKQIILGLYNNRFVLNGEKSYTYETKEDVDGVYITVDLTKNTVGYPSFDVEVDEDTRLVVSYGEHLDDLRPRSNVAGYQFAYEVQLKKGKNTFVFPIRRTACRYFTALFYTKKVTVNYFGMRECIYPIESPSQFSCSDSIHTRIFDVAQRTLRLCMHDHYEDCPSREQGMYIMDTQIQALCGYYALGEYQFPKSCFEMMVNSLRDDNFFEMIFPGTCVHTIPCFSINFIPLVWEYYMFSGDVEILEKTFDTMQKLIGERLAVIDEKTGLIPSPQGEKFWNFLEWQKGSDGVFNGVTNLDFNLFHMAYNGFYSLVCRAFSNVCKTLGKDDQAEKFEKLYESINKSIHKYFYNDEMKAYTSCISFERDVESYYTELASSLAICCGACPDECIDNVLESIASGKFLSITTSHAKYKYDALMTNPDKYNGFVMDEIADIWGGMLYQGATSFWETANGSKDFSLSGSQCHGWSATPIYVYFRYGLGIYPEKPGFKEYTVAPKIKGYTFKGKFKTPNGTIEL